MRQNSEPVARLAGVTRRFGDVTAVDDLSLEIHRGESVAMVGPNGAGKTTTIEMLLGLLEPHAGTVQVFGNPPARAVAGGRVAAMLQDAGLPHGVRVAELIEMIAELYGDPLPIDEVLQAADLQHFADRQVQQLSGGQRQRVRLALALAGDPDLVVLDEPTAALDVEARQAFWQRVDAAVSGGRTVLFATHRLEEADAVADRVIVIADGRLLADGTPEDVKAQAAKRSSVRFSADGVDQETLERLPAVQHAEFQRGRWVLQTADPDRTTRALLQQVPQLEGLEVTRAALEEAFLSLIQRGNSQ